MDERDGILIGPLVATWFYESLKFFFGMFSRPLAEQKESALG
jgi:hypothetical protein